MDMQSTHSIFYKEINKLRDLFHSHGKFDDSNAKLDEIAKYIAIYVYQLKHKTSKTISLVTLIQQYEITKFDIVSELKHIFKQVSISSDYLKNGTSIFGDQPLLNINDNDNDFAYHLVKFVVNSIDSLKNNDLYDFDIINEAFGNFIRDNFRNNVEDAQYMTPNEVVEFMVDIAVSDLIREQKLQDINEFIVCDPCCGVGSFLSSIYRRLINNEPSIHEKIVCVGQDKVSRMVRLAKINMNISNNSKSLIFSGNSLSGNSSLDEYNGTVDLILTNPPFGAKFNREDLTQNAQNNFPILNDVIFNNIGGIDSEILFVDRCISLLKPGGKLLAVLPDSIISSEGINSVLRQRIMDSNELSIKAIVELPAVTFAQAGTRTKTSIVYLEKSCSNNAVFVAECNDIGFEVSVRKGATVKKELIHNDLLQISSIYKSYFNQAILSYPDSINNILNYKPSCTLVSLDELSKSWTPSHYNANKYEAISLLKTSSDTVDLFKLGDIVEFISRKRSKEYNSIDGKCISVLHVYNIDNLSYEDMMGYNPKYPGIVCRPGDLIYSKINPRILRILVIPELGVNLTCSSEFEIMQSKIDISNFGIKLLLMSPLVQRQINCLTSGTSSSHNRIKSRDLQNVLIPIPKKNTKSYDKFMEEVKQYEDIEKELFKLKMQTLKMKSSTMSFLNC